MTGINLQNQVLLPIGRYKMQIMDLQEKHEPLYFLCLEDWSDEIKEGGDHKKNWYDHMKDKGLGVKIAVENEQVYGMIQYLPIEHSFVEGSDLYFIHCIWVHGHKQGIGNQQKRGIGKKLLQAAEDDVKMKGTKGIVAWGISMPFWMKASWFKKQGYKKIDKDGMRVLMWKPFSDDATPPIWIKEKKRPQRVEGKVKVTAFKNGWCPAQNLVFERAKRAVDQFGAEVVFEEISTLDQKVFEEWGIVDGLYIDGKQVNTGPPPSFDKIKKKIAKRVRKLT
jgi:N-acetylglutamate synthase-like GNAT family acetyltransferase